MTRESVRQFLIRNNIEFVFNEHIPDDIAGMPTDDLYVLTRHRMIFDPFQRLTYNEIREFELAYYTVFQPSTIGELRNTLNQYGISHEQN